MDSSASKRKKKVIDAKKKMQNMSREQIKAAIEKKKECNARAMAIVEKLIEPGVDQYWLLENLIHINQCHFQDAVEERAIIKSCGYPLCDAALKDIPRKQFHISTKQNKVFDITDRKNYCSNLCYKAGVFLKDQLFTSPLWLRDCEDHVTYSFYSSAPTSGITGLEIDLGNTNPIKPDDVECKNPEENGINTENNANTDSLETKGDIDSENEEFVDAREDVDDISDKLKTATINCVNADGVSANEEYFLSQTSFTEPESPSATHVPQCKTSPHIKDSCDLVSRRIRTNSEKSDKRKSTENETSGETIQKKIKPNLPVDVKIEKIVLEWFTLESLTFIYGEDKVKEMFQEFGSPLNEIKFNKIRDTYMYERYEEICKKLNILEIKDKDEKVPTPSKPLPNYDQLKREAKELEVKVRTFYKGDSKVTFRAEEIENDSKDVDADDDCPPVLPLVDHHAIRATRRRIMIDKLNRTLPDILSALNLSQFSVRKEVKELVFTLSLSATNIVMKPSEWNLVAIILIRIMTIRNECLRMAYFSDLTQRRVVNLLMTYNLDLNYVERQIVNISDIEQIIRNSQ